jgi:hypothetical protein
MIGVTLPPTDKAYGQGFAILTDPFVVTIAGSAVLPSGLIAGLLHFFFLKRDSIFSSCLVLLAFSLFGTLVLTYFGPMIGWIGSYVAWLITFFAIILRNRNVQPT